MANATGFRVDLSTMDIKMNRGDTGSLWVAASRASEEAWTEDIAHYVDEHIECFATIK